ncbi:MAG: carbohydrate-binding protein [Fibrobacter sp.]|nr:carbohydrate-binding protein [Fibrobacter sp.]
MGCFRKKMAVVACSVFAMALAVPSFAATRQVERLNRGLVAAKVNGGMLVSWRLLGTESPTTQFNLYRDGKKIASIGEKEATNYLDADGSASSVYSLSSVVDGVESKQQGTSLVFSENKDGFPYKTIRVDVPADQKMPDGSTCSYTANDMSVGDLDGDGELELVLKWDPSNSQDNSKDGYTGSVILDGLKLDGTKLWRIDLGKNIRAGAHYTQFMVYDLDGDGIAEIVAKTSDGTVDGKGTVIGDKNKDYRTTAGRIMSGNEFLTVFNGKTGAAVHTIDYWPGRNITNNWGDTYGNRSERMLAAIAYLDGVHPSVVMVRGYYTNAYLAAYDFDGKELKQRWLHKSEKSGEGMHGQGNHNLSVGDVDGDGYDEIIFGSAALKHDGTLKYRVGLGHGDAMHLSDLDPDLPGLELWDVHEDTGVAYSDEMHDKDGKIIWGTKQTGKDNGRGMAADIDSTVRGFEMWSGASGGVRDSKGKLVSSTVPSVNFRIYFDGDLQDELMDASGDASKGRTGGKIEKWNSSTKTVDRMFNFYSVNDAYLNNYTKANPCIVADLLGDWREEFIARSNSDPSVITLFTTKDVTKHRVYTLMHDTHYRVSVAWQNVAYNQPPHLGYYLPDAVKNLQRPDVYAVGDTIDPPSYISSSSGDISPSSSETTDFPYASVLNAANPEKGNGTYEATNTGWLNDGYYNFANEVGSDATWTVYVKKSATSKFAVRFANGGNASRDMILTVNGKDVGTLAFAATGGWTEYKSVELDSEITLNEGANTIKLTSVSTDGGPNVDEFGFTLAGVAFTEEEAQVAPAKFENVRNSFDAVTGTLCVSESGVAEIYVYDVSGHMVTGLSKFVSAGESVLSLDKSLLGGGIYMVKVLFNGRLISKSAVKHLK